MTETLDIDRRRPSSPRPPSAKLDRFCNRYRGDTIALILASAFIALVALGMFLGNVFEVYHSASSL